MATRLYMLSTTPPGGNPKPSTKQSATTIQANHWLTGTQGGGQDSGSGIYPCMMDTGNGTSNDAISKSIAEPGATHYGWVKAFVSRKLAAQTISGTMTVSWDFQEGNAAQNMMPRIYVYVWKGDNTGIRGTLYAETQSATEADTSLDSQQTFFSSVSLSSVDAQDGDVVVVEILFFDNNTKTATYTHAFGFNGSTGRASYVELSANLSWLATAQVVTDGISLADEAVKSRALLITDTTGVTLETILRGKGVVESDSLGVTAETVLTDKDIIETDSMAVSSETILRGKSVVITESVGLVDSKIRDITLLPQADTVSLLDAIIVQVGSVTDITVSDASSLSQEDILIHKILVILDSIALDDSVTKEISGPTPEVEQAVHPTESGGGFAKRPTRRRVKPKPKKPNHVVISDLVNLRDEVRANIYGLIAEDFIQLSDERITVHKIITMTDDLHLDDVVKTHKRIVLQDTLELAELVLQDYIWVKQHDAERYARQEVVLALQAKALETSQRIREKLSRSKNPLNKLRIRDMKDPSLMSNAMSGYEKSLVRLFETFQEKIPQMLRSLEKTQSPRELADEPDINRVQDDIGTFIQLNIITPGQKVVDSNITKTYKASGMRAAQFLKGLGIDAKLSMGDADENTLNILKTRNLSSLTGITDAMSKDIMQTITNGVLKGESPWDMAKEISETVDNIGITRARVLARTETMYAFNASAVTQYEKYGVDGVEWLTAHDERRCDQCAPLDGKRFPIGEQPDCPLHPNCRCVLLPIIPEVR